MAVLFSIDAHAAGGSCRIVYAGFPALSGAGAQERREFFRTNLDWVRTCLMHEPRGHGGEFGALLAPPVRASSSFSLIFFDPAGYVDGCGHGTLCSVAAWQRMIGELATPLDIDNPDGSVTRVLAAEGNGERCTATLLMPRGAVLEHRVQLPWRGGIDAAVVRCGNTYVIVDARQLGAVAERLFSANGQRGRLLSEILAAATSLGIGAAHTVIEVLAFQPMPGDRGYETAVLFNGTQIDRSPCGTGSGALGCLLLERGEIRAGERITTYGPTRLPFDLAVSRASGGGGYEVQLSGTAYITGVHEWIVSGDDPLRSGVPAHTWTDGQE